MKNTFEFAVVWQQAPASGSVEVSHGKLESLALNKAAGNKAKGVQFFTDESTSARLVGSISDASVERGAFATRVTLRTSGHSFTFFLRDLNPRSPMWIPDYGVAVVSAKDERTYDEIAAAVRSRGLITEGQKIALEPEETFEEACARNRDQPVPTWLGISRDMRLFEVSYSAEMGYWGKIQARYPGSLQQWPESDDAPISINFCLGRGAGCSVDITRHLDEGVLPILHSTQRDGDISYEITTFATLETEPLSNEKLRGTDVLASYANSVGNMMTDSEVNLYKSKLERPEKLEREEETVCVFRCEAVNYASVPRYAFIKAGHASWVLRDAQEYDPKTGFCPLSSGRVFAINLLDGRPVPQEEMAILLQPGESATYQLLVPHLPISKARAKKLAKLDFQKHLAACRAFWKEKLAAGAQVSVPEAAVSERINAGLLHCDLVAYGLEPRGSVAATIGVYAPIGSESSPIIQFFDAMGWHDLAARSLNFFIDRQREDGFIQNFGGYQLETGPALWSMGEHYRYTRDDKWARSVKAGVLKACDYLLAWRERNKREDLRGNGYGLIDGKVADPEDFFHSFMLNGLSYAGLQRSAELLENIAPKQAKRIATEAAAYREDIRMAYLESVERSPVVPLGDGSWVPSFSTWTESPGPVTLFAEGEKWFTHGTFLGRDSMLGAQYLVIGEVFDANEPASAMLLRAHQELCLLTNAAFSQPYYSRHDYMHAQRGEVKEFLKTFYNQFTALQDRETYTFWEHYFYVSPHKTHEEGWFLMQARWMLYLEAGDTLKLLPLIPRQWLENGKEIKLEKMASYFGAFDLHVESRLEQGVIEATVKCTSKRAPKEVLLRLPHPEGRHPVQVQGGEYSAETETVRISNFRKAARVELRY
ncbi:MAG: hypothetical protein ABI210_05905 [Abditibacteriaceae bacterium]